MYLPHARKIALKKCSLSEVKPTFTFSIISLNLAITMDEILLNKYNT